MTFSQSKKKPVKSEYSENDSTHMKKEEKHSGIGKKRPVSLKKQKKKIQDDETRKNNEKKYSELKMKLKDNTKQVKKTEEQAKQTRITSRNTIRILARSIAKHKASITEPAVEYIKNEICKIIVDAANRAINIAKCENEHSKREYENPKSKYDENDENNSSKQKSITLKGKHIEAAIQEMSL